MDVVKPDVALVLDTGIATDIPGMTEPFYKLTGGPVASFVEPGMITNLKLRNLVIDVARKNDIPVQIIADNDARYGTDADVIHVYQRGVPAIMIGPAVRHIHSHTGIFHRTDYDLTVKLLVALIKELDSKTVAGFTEW